MQKKRIVQDFDFYIDEYMYYCRSRRLRPNTMQSYEQTLRLFERWCEEEESLVESGQVTEQVIRRYICSLRAFFTWCTDERRGNNPMDRIRQLPCERKPQEFLEDEEVKLTKKVAG